MKESGWVPALTGLSLSYDQDWKDMWPVADKLANKDGGHTSFSNQFAFGLTSTLPVIGGCNSIHTELESRNSLVQLCTRS